MNQRAQELQQRAYQLLRDELHSRRQEVDEARRLAYQEASRIDEDLAILSRLAGGDCED